MIYWKYEQNTRRNQAFQAAFARARGVVDKKIPRVESADGQKYRAEKKEQ